MTGLEIGLEAAKNEDCKTALRILPAFAEEGFGDAQLALGGIYFRGICIPQNYILAYMWVSISIVMLEEGPVKHAAITARDLTAAKMYPADIGQAQKLAKEWFDNYSKKQKK